MMGWGYPIKMPRLLLYAHSNTASDKVIIWCDVSGKYTKRRGQRKPDFL